MRRLYFCALPLTVLMCACLALSASTKHHHASSNGQPGNFDYYLLSVSWAPNYCAGYPSDHSSECRAGAAKGFVLHGLWPQADSGPYLENCGTASPVSSDIVNHMLNYMPSASLIQHEWQTHGTCSGLSAQDYFDKVVQAFSNLHVPSAYQQVNAQQETGAQNLEAAFASANGAPAGAFRLSCHAGELVNLEACLSKDLKYQSCGSSVTECPSKQVLMRPVK